MTGVSALWGEYVRTFVKRPAARPGVKRPHRVKSDAEVLRVMAAQARLLAAIEMTRKGRGLTVERFASAAGISERSYRRVMSGAHVVRAATIAKLRTAQRRAAAGYLT